MKRFIKNILTFVVFAVIVPIVTAYLLPSNPANYLNAYGIKQHRLDSIQSNRLVLVGASELAFGIDSKMLEDSLGMNVINCGLHGGLGIDFIVRDAINNARAGDLIVFSPSYTFKAGGVGETTTIPFMIDFYPQKWEDLNLKNKGIAIEGGYKLLNGKLYYLQSKIQGHPQKFEAYSSVNFNKYGDSVANWADSLSHPSIQGITYQVHNVDLEYLRGWLKQVDELKAKGCNVIFVPRILQNQSFDNSEDVIRLLEREFQEAGYPFAFSPEEVKVDDSMLYDNPSHPNRKGAVFYTNKIIGVVRNYVNPF